MRELLLALGAGDAELQDFVLATALALPGVTGMFARLERHPEEGDAPATLLDLLAIATLRGYTRVFLGAPVRSVAPDLLPRERVVVVGIIAVLLVLGMVPRLIIGALPPP